MVRRGEDAVRHRPVQGVVRREAACGKECRMIEFIPDKGAAVPEHSHPHEQIGVVVRGKVQLRTKGKRTVLRAGDGYSIVSGEVRGVEVPEGPWSSTWSPRRARTIRTGGPKPATRS